MKKFSPLCLREGIAIIFLLLGCIVNAQENFTRKDSLHGGLRFERTCYDVLRYDLNIKINPAEKSILGFTLESPSRKVCKNYFAKPFS
jgi:hypothetical protein